MRKGSKVNKGKEVGSFEDCDQKGFKDPETRITRKNSVTRDEVGQVNPSLVLQSPEFHAKGFWMVRESDTGA